MTAEQIEQYRVILQTQLATLLREAGKTVAEMTDEHINFPDPTDRASMESERNFELRIRDRERRLISKIRDALVRIDEGTFGICSVCEEEISAERLQARPVATLCIDCKTEQERQERIG